MSKKTKSPADESASEDFSDRLSVHQTHTIDEFAEPAYLAYAMKVVKDRAIPDVEDGLKPVQRRILYAMDELKLLPQNAKPMKSARVVGQTIGKYHPHGDSSVYEAMVRMAQPFSMRYPLVHGEGNFGSRDGDSAAAMRYTEARLAPIAHALLSELSHDTVDMKLTYDNTTVEPVTLPARLPFLMLNGTFGVAVGMATNIPSHNLNEVVEACKLIINKKKVTLDEVLAVMPGPDFATGGQIISSNEDIRKAYEEGRGRVRVRAKWKVEHYGKNNKDWRVAIYEIPPDTSSAKVIAAIGELMDPTPPEKGGKRQPLKPEQLRLKKMFGDMIERAVDASDDKTPVNLIIEPKNRQVDVHALMTALCSHTPLEMNVSINLVSIDLGGAPRNGHFLEWLSQWCDYRIHTVYRRLTDEKNRVDHRLHILQGRLSILDKIDQVIKIIRTSDDPKADLMSKFKLSEIQAEDVLETRLRSLANLEQMKLQEEHDRLVKEQQRLAKLLSDDKALRKLVVQELDADVKSFGDERRTEINPQEASASRKQLLEVISTPSAPEPVAVVLTERGWLGWRPAKSLEEAQLADYKVKTGDAIKRVFFADRAHHLLLLSQKGRAYSLRMTDLPSKSDMVPLTQFFDLEQGDRFLEAVVAVTPQDKFVVASNAGNGFIVEASSWINRMKAGKVFLTMSEEDLPLTPLCLSAEQEKEALLALSSDGRFVAFPVSDLKVLPRGKGMAMIGLAANCKMVDMALHTPTSPAVLKINKGKTYTLSASEVEGSLSPRSSSRKGKLLHKDGQGEFVRPERTGPISSAP